MNRIKVFAPNSVSNVGCGFDVLGFAIEGYGDQISVEKRDDDQLVISSIEGADLPTDPKINVASVAISALLGSLGRHDGFTISIKKAIAPGSGLGSSASSSAGAVFAVNELLDRPFSTKELVAFAMEGERSSSGSAHADNVAPSLLGGFTVVQNIDPLDVFNIPFPKELLAVVIYPEVEIKTADAKRILKPEIGIQKAVRQSANMAGLISGLISSDFDRIGKSIEDAIAEPIRKALIPFYEEVKKMALSQGALGFNISGSGPSMFAFTNDPIIAERVRSSCELIYSEKKISVKSFVSSINAEGAKVI